jgi:hypothetical protein
VIGRAPLFAVSPFYADCTMMCPDHRAIDHVGGGVAPRQLGQRLEHRIEHAGRDPSSIAPEDAVPLAMLIGKMLPLRAGPGDPRHALEVAAVILRRSATATALRRQQRPDQRPFFIRYPNPLAQGRLESSTEPPVKLCPRSLVFTSRHRISVELINKLC